MNKEHLNIEQRKIIQQMLTSKTKLVDIAKTLQMDPTSISKEIKRSRTLYRKAAPSEKKVCKKLDRYPYVCNCCTKRYYDCPFAQYIYKAQYAQDRADFLLKEKRIGINMTKEEFTYLDKTIKEGLANKESIYHIVTSNDDIHVSVCTVYRYINKNYLSTKRIDLPYAVTYKKRKAKIKEYEYLENNRIDRSNRTFIDYLAYKSNSPNTFCIQMDFLGSIKSDVNSILTLTIPDLHFVMLFLIEKKNSNKIVSLFDSLEECLGIRNYNRLFNIIITDRDPSFSDFMGIEHSKVTGEERSRIFYCDPFKSNQKANVENMNKQLRKYFPKGDSVDDKTNEDMRNVMNFINNLRIPSLSGFTPNEAFIRVYGKSLLEQLLTVFD